MSGHPWFSDIERTTALRETEYALYAEPATQAVRDAVRDVERLHRLLADAHEQLKEHEKIFEALDNALSTDVFTKPRDMPDLIAGQTRDLEDVTPLATAFAWLVRVDFDHTKLDAQGSEVVCEALDIVKPGAFMPAPRTASFIDDDLPF